MSSSRIRFVLPPKPAGSFEVMVMGCAPAGSVRQPAMTALAKSLKLAFMGLGRVSGQDALAPRRADDETPSYAWRLAAARAFFLPTLYTPGRLAAMGCNLKS